MDGWIYAQRVLLRFVFLYLFFDDKACLSGLVDWLGMSAMSGSMRDGIA